MEFSYAFKYEYEYEALIAKLRMASAMNIKQLIILGDFKIIFQHVTGSFKAKEKMGILQS